MLVCPVCEGFTSTRLERCGTCDVPLVGADEVAWPTREAEPVASPWIGLLVGGKYRITGVLGKGGMGTVYRAVHELSLQPVALKILHPRFARREDFRHTLIAEARKASLLRSEQVARVMDVGETPEGSVFYAMELVDGVTLEEWVRASGRLDAATVVELMRQLCDALAESAAAGIVHRDLSPRNVMVEMRGDGFQVKVLDFGIAQFAAGQSSEDQGRDHPRQDHGNPGFWINPPFTAPEILAGGSGDVRADLYSLGVLGYLAATGRLPHGGGALEDRVHQVLEEPPASLAGSGVPRRLARLLRALLEKDPDVRPHNVAHVRELIQRGSRPTPLAFMVVSVLIFIAGATMFLTGFAERVLPTLQSYGASKLHLRSDRAPSSAEYLKKEDLREVRLNASGLGSGELSVRGYVGGEQRFSQFELGRVAGGLVHLDGAKWVSVLEECTATAAGVTLNFFHSPTNRVLAYARLFVDVERPVFEEVKVLPAGTLHVDSTLTIRASDDTRLKHVRLRLLRIGEEQVLAHVESPIPDGGLQIPIGKELLKGARGNALDNLGQAHLDCTVVDSAGREEFRRLVFERADLFIPRIRRVRSLEGESEIRVEGGKCDLRLELDGELRGKHAVLAYQTGLDPEQPLDCERLHELDLPDSICVRMTVPKSNGRAALRFLLMDEAGNRAAYPVHLEFRSLSLNPVFVCDDSKAQLTLRGGTDVLYVPADQRVLLGYTCNQAYEPKAVSRGGHVWTTWKSSSGKCSIVIGPIGAAADATLEVRHTRGGTEIESKSSLRVICLAKRVGVEPAALFSAGQAPSALRLTGEQGVVVEQDGDYARVTSGLRLSIPEHAAAVGRLWVEHEGQSWVAVGPLAPIDSLGSLADLRIPLGNRHNRIALELRDVLGRPIEDLAQNPESREVLVEGQRAVVIASFVHDKTRPEVLPVLVEYGQLAVVSLRDDLKFPAGAEVALRELDRAFPGTYKAVGDGTICRIPLLFADVQRLCKWTDVAAADFPGQLQRSKRTFHLLTPFRKWKIEVEFVPTRSLLRAVTLGSLEPKLGPSIRSLEMVPFLGPDKDDVIELGPPSTATHVAGSVRPEPPLRVEGLGDFFLSAREVTRTEYAAFMAHVLASRALPWRTLGHAEDPLGRDRFTTKGLAPQTGVFGGSTLAKLVEAAPDRPVTGINYYQAQAFARWLGWRALGNPQMFRLPFAVELEWAAIRKPAAGDSPLNGLRAPPGLGGKRFQAFFLGARARGSKAGRMDAARWPPNPAELAAIGDFAPGPESDRAFGLDFGVREWVEDLPTVGMSDAVRLSFSSHTQQRKFAESRRKGDLLKVSIGRGPARGEVRGLGLGEPVIGESDPLDSLVDGYTGDQAHIGPGLLGVKRIICLRRDGVGATTGSASPLISVIGFRVAGTQDFLRRARRAR